ncbi:hypothetical protein CPJCM30710_19760 [Clostridium polyendosporum]|uniref:Uncharacterized protein n=1 Tax=Clostridium polyendosporum TaxID=69208 RepID=A0A919VGE7_9CLOT|nr:hypothetical protein [Clostridium polyendosporum]GIM29310.1 hypothetical protein CPJCM30710_19760 [Clostridium polyendosporum]
MIIFKAKERGGKCEIIEEEYFHHKSRTTKVSHQAIFVCNQNHPPFQLNKTQFISGEWCPTCFNPILEIIKSKGGRCSGNHTVYKPTGITISCGNKPSHRFNLTVEQLIKGEWCPKCQ